MKTFDMFNEYIFETAVNYVLSAEWAIRKNVGAFVKQNGNDMSKSLAEWYDIASNPHNITSKSDKSWYHYRKWYDELIATKMPFRDLYHIAFIRGVVLRIVDSKGKDLFRAYNAGLEIGIKDTFTLQPFDYYDYPDYNRAKIHIAKHLSLLFWLTEQLDGEDVFIYNNIYAKDDIAYMWMKITDRPIEKAKAS